MTAFGRKHKTCSRFLRFSAAEDAGVDASEGRSSTSDVGLEFLKGSLQRFASVSTDFKLQHDSLFKTLDAVRLVEICS